MAIIESGVTTDLLTIDPVMKAARTTSRPFEYGTGGFYQLAKRTGTLPATLAANGELLQFRWTSASLLAVILEIKMHFQVLTAFTAHQEVSFEANRVNTFTAAGTGGGIYTITNGKLRTSFPNSAVGEIRIATTAALGAGTKTIEPDPFAYALGSPNIVNAAAGTAYSPYNQPAMFWRAAISDGDHPIVLAQNEGFIIRNMVVWPAAGTGVAAFSIKWAEVQAF